MERMIHINNNDLYKLEEEAQKVAKEVHEYFANLSDRQINWKPNPESWSIAQCLDHLVNTNRKYFPIFEEILLGEKRKRFFERVSFLSDFWGKLLTKSYNPESKRKSKAPRIFMPGASKIDLSVIPRFSESQGRLIGFMQATSYLNLKQTYITSPVAKFVTYSLHDAYEIILQHERRHIRQALCILEMEHFPQDIVRAA